MAASYVKFFESAGARVVPIMSNKGDSYYEYVFNSVNGVVFPGGAQDLVHSEYTRVSKLAMQHSIDQHEKANYFPIWGTCCGFEQLVGKINI